MLIPSHIMFADLLYQYIQQELKLPLNRLSFIYGNFEPDISFKSLSSPHFYPESLHFIKQSIETLKETPEINSNTFSRKLGHICHYVCDFFCIYHNSYTHRRQPLTKHLTYEFALHSQLINMTLSQKILLKQWSEELTSSSTLTDKIETYIDQYATQTHTMSIDIKYALCTSLVIAKQILLCPNIYFQLKPQLQYI